MIEVGGEEAGVAEVDSPEAVVMVSLFPTLLRFYGRCIDWASPMGLIASS